MNEQYCWMEILLDGSLKQVTIFPGEKQSKVYSLLLTGIFFFNRVSVISATSAYQLLSDSV